MNSLHAPEDHNVLPCAIYVLTLTGPFRKRRINSASFSPKSEYFLNGPMHLLCSFFVLNGVYAVMMRILQISGCQQRHTVSKSTRRVRIDVNGRISIEDKSPGFKNVTPCLDANKCFAPLPMNTQFAGGFYHVCIQYAFYLHNF